MRGVRELSAACFLRAEFDRFEAVEFFISEGWAKNWDCSWEFLASIWSAPLFFFGGLASDSC